MESPNFLGGLRLGVEWYAMVPGNVQKCLGSAPKGDLVSNNVKCDEIPLRPRASLGPKLGPIGTKIFQSPLGPRFPHM
jgi:hypothetical protein